MTLKLACLGLGIAFGLLLVWCGMTEYDAIQDMLLLRKPDLFLTMGSAIATAAVGVRILRRRGARAVIAGEPIAWSTALPTRKTIAGSVLFGLGWGVAGTCPGPAAAQLGRGQLVALFTVGGLLAGVLLHGVRERRAAPRAPRPLVIEPEQVGL